MAAARPLQSGRRAQLPDSLLLLRQSDRGLELRLCAAGAKAWASSAMRSSRVVSDFLAVSVWARSLEIIGVRRPTPRADSCLLAAFRTWLPETTSRSS
eukprot:4647681-Pyramimonas_sp.AAC.1